MDENETDLRKPTTNSRAFRFSTTSDGLCNNSEELITVLRRHCTVSIYGIVAKPEMPKLGTCISDIHVANQSHTWGPSCIDWKEV